MATTDAMKLKDLIGNKAYIYGTGNFALRIKNVLNEENINITAFLELNKEISAYDRLPVYKLDDFQNLDKTIPVIIGLGNPQADIKIVTIQLESSGFQTINPIQFTISAYNSGHSFENYWLTGDLSLYDKDKNKIDLARSLLNDEKSKKIFDNVIQYRKTGRIEFLPEKLEVDVQYIAPDLPWNKTFDRGLDVLDGGAFDGDTYENFKKAGINISSWIFIEPDLENFRKITSKYENKNSNFQYLNVALSKNKSEKPFTSSSASDNGSRISSIGNRVVSTVNIDSLNFKVDPNFIKFDIEGEELNALEGGIESITKLQPILAISSYHLPEHHWKLLIYLYSSLPSYRFYIRVHGNQTFDTILYGLPGS